MGIWVTTGRQKLSVFCASRHPVIEKGKKDGVPKLADKSLGTNVKRKLMTKKTRELLDPREQEAI